MRRAALKEDKKEVLYLGSAGLVHFVSRTNDFKNSGGLYYTIEELNATSPSSNRNQMPFCWRIKCTTFICLDVGLMINLNG